MLSNTCGSENQLVYTMFLFIESILFGMFTLCMLGDQLSSLRTNQTQIDRLKNEKHEIKVLLTVCYRICIFSNVKRIIAYCCIFWNYSVLLFN